MISKHTILLYCKDYEKIENYEQAINDETQTWHCHHRLETHFSDGTERPIKAQLKATELIALNMYYDRPPEEFIFLTNSEHRRLHMLGKHIGTFAKGRKLSEEHKKKLSETHKGNTNALGHKASEEARKKMSKAHKGKRLSDEHKKKISEAGKGHKAWNLGGKLSEETKKKLSDKFKGKHWKLVDGKRVWY